MPSFGGDPLLADAVVLFVDGLVAPAIQDGAQGVIGFGKTSLVVRFENPAREDIVVIREG